MLDRDKASFYYKSLLFNHYESGGTCEQRVLVLRARFDRILEELSEHNEEFKNFYVEKLQQVFKVNPSGFTKKTKEECHALRKYLNGVQHSTFEADERQYVLSVKRLCQIIYLTSKVNIPSNLSSIWMNKTIEDRVENRDMIILNSSIHTSRFPVAICIDTRKISNNYSKRNRLNNVLLNFIKDISDNELPIELSLYFIEESKVKVVNPFKNKVSLVEIDSNFKDAINELMNNIYTQLTDEVEKKNGSNQTKHFGPWFISMLNQDLLNCLLPNDNFTKKNTSDLITVIPVGLTSGMQLDNYKSICNKREGMILQEGKEEEFFNWLINCFKIICLKK